MNNRKSGVLGWARNLLGRLAITALILAVFALYMRYLGRQSLWFDEGLSVLFAARPLPQLFRTLIYEDLHPPLYYLLLHFWMALVGNSEWAVRMPSLFAAVLLMPLNFAIVREILGQGAEVSTRRHTLGISAAVLVGTSPFIAYYAQETRMYTLAALLVLATTWAFLRATRTAARRPSLERSERWWLCFSCLLAAGLYTQYFSAFVMPAFVLYAFLLDRQWLRHTVLHTLLAGVLYIPWIVPAYMQVGRLLRTPDYWVTTRINPVWFARTMWRAFLPSTPARSWLLVIVIGVLVLVRLARRGKLRFLLRSGAEYQSDPVRRRKHCSQIRHPLFHRCRRAALRLRYHGLVCSARTEVSRDAGGVCPSGACGDGLFLALYSSGHYGT
jgi:uncharacterized membrane protein